MIDDPNKLQKSVRPQLVVGFLFTSPGHVILIRKDKPDWQKGKLNGVGGKVEPGENPAAAMAREWKEETGEERPAWNHFLQLDVGTVTIHFFRAFDENSTAKTNESEIVVRAEVNSLSVSRCYMRCHYGSEVMRIEVLPNLQWIIPMALHEQTQTYVLQ